MFFFFTKYLFITAKDRSALSSFRKEFFTPLRNASKATVGRTSCGSNDGFPTVGVAERSLGKIVPKGDFSQLIYISDKISQSNPKMGGLV